MKAVICTRYGSPGVLQLQEVVRPELADDEVLVRVRAASINARDVRLMRADPFVIRLRPGGLLRPPNPILGADLAGRVESVGRGATRFRPDDEVFGYLPAALGRGTFAEYACVPEGLLALKPATLTFEQAAAAPLAAMTALQALRDHGRLQPGQRVLIYGATGGVGTFAVQIARALGAGVTAACSAKNADLARSLGAAVVLDDRRDPLVSGADRYDLIVAVNGYRPIGEYLRALTPEGRYVVIGGSMRQVLEAAWQCRRSSRSERQQTRVVSLTPSQTDLTLLKQLLESGQVTPVIDRCFPLSQAAAAFESLERSHARGKIVLTIPPPSTDRSTHARDSSGDD